MISSQSPEIFYQEALHLPFKESNRRNDAMTFNLYYLMVLDLTGFNYICSSFHHQGTGAFYYGMGSYSQ